MMKKNYSIKLNFEISAKRFWTILIPGFVLAAIAGVFIGIAMIDNVVIPNLPGMNPRGIITVPNIVKLQLDEAKEKLYGVGLRMDIVDKVYNNQIPAGAIVAQDPKAGESAKKERHIQATISRGSEISKIPGDILKQTERNARNLLLKAGFDDMDVRHIYSDKYPKDQVYECAPAPGTTTSREQTIHMIVSRGEEPKYVEMPNICGLVLSEAQAKIEENGLVLGYVGNKRGVGRPGYVVEQGAAAGAQILPGSKINLTVGSE